MGRAAVTPAQCAAVALAYLLPLAALALGWWGERRAHRRTRAALDRERATVEAARRLPPRVAAMLRRDRAEAEGYASDEADPYARGVDEGIVMGRASLAAAVLAAMGQPEGEE